MSEKAITAEQVRYIQRIMNMEPISLSTPIGDDKDGSEMGDFIEATEQPLPDELAIQNDIRRIIYDALEQLEPRAGVCIKKYYGLDDGVPKTLEQIGNNYGVTRERIRQIISKGTRKLSFLLRRSGIEQ